MIYIFSHVFSVYFIWKINRCKKLHFLTVQIFIESINTQNADSKNSYYAEKHVLFNAINHHQYNKNKIL